MRLLGLAVLLLLVPLALPLGEGAQAPAEWPPLEDAKIRPGVQVRISGAQCTTNFVFTDAAGVRYIGTAAHCVDHVPVGATVSFGKGGSGTLVYDSWRAMADAGETDPQALKHNDFAILRVADADQDLVHPAMLHFGGPTAMAHSPDVRAGDKVLTYGHSMLRLGIDPANWHEGYVVSDFYPWHRTVWTVTPGIPGDSGSGMLTGDGQALGIVVTLYLAGGFNGVTLLDKALDYARTHGGPDVQLATWDLLDAGLLPSV